jgi:predicted permease
MPSLDDVRDAWRSLTLTPAITAFVVVAIAVGTGLNATVIGWLDGLLFRPPAGIPSPDRLVSICRSTDVSSCGLATFGDYVDARKRADGVALVAAYKEGVLSELAYDHRGASIRLAEVSGDFFDVIGVVPENRQRQSDAFSIGPGGVVLGHRPVTAALSGIDSLLGRTVTIEKHPFEIAGLLSPGFAGLDESHPVDAWVRLAASGHVELSLVGRLAPGGTVESLNRALAPTFRAVHYSQMQPMSRSHVSLIGLVMVGATGMFIFVTCTSIAVALLARTTSRRAELAIRAVLGATGERLYGHILCEAGLLSIGGASAGLLVSYWSTLILNSLITSEQAELKQFGMSLKLFVSSTALSFVIAAVFVLRPALQAVRSANTGGLRSLSGELTAGIRGARLRATVLVLQVGLACVLLLSAVTLRDALSGARRRNGSAEPDRLALLSTRDGSGGADTARFLRAIEEAVRRARVLTGVREVAAASRPPYANTITRTFGVHNGTSGSTDSFEADALYVTPTYFATVGVHLDEGRLVDEKDAATSRPILVVNEEFARRYNVHTGDELLEADAVRRIVGVVANLTYGLHALARPTAYYPLTQSGTADVTIIVRTTSPALPLLESLRIAAIPRDGALVVGRATTLEAELWNLFDTDRLASRLIETCALASLCLSISGVVSVTSYTVASRTREIGVRFALGASPTAIAGLVLRRTFVLAGVGLSGGVGLALAAIRLANFTRPEIAEPAASAVCGTVVVVAVVTLIGCLVPLRRALGITPLVAMRLE